MPKTESADDAMLVKAAKTIGAAAGKIAALAGVEAGESPAPRTAAPKVSKLKKHTKTRLPRLEKKANKKKAAAALTK